MANFNILKRQILLSAAISTLEYFYTDFSEEGKKGDCPRNEYIHACVNRETFFQVSGNLFGCLDKFKCAALIGILLSEGHPSTCLFCTLVLFMLSDWRREGICEGSPIWLPIIAATTVEVMAVTGGGHA